MYCTYVYINIKKLCKTNLVYNIASEATYNYINLNKKYMSI